MGFNLNTEEYKFQVEVLNGAGKTTVTHILRAPTDDELEEYIEKMSEFDTVNKVYKSTRAKAGMWLWDKLIISVEGYDFVGDFESLKKKIPFTHKTPCIDMVTSVGHIVSENEAAEIAKK